MAGEQPEFAEVTKPPKKSRWQAYNDEQDRLFEETRQAMGLDALRSQTILFHLKIDDASDIPLVFQTKTGQAAVRDDALHTKQQFSRGRGHRPDYARIKVSDGLHLMKRHKWSYRSLPSYIDPTREFPSWLYTPTNEPRADWKRPMRWVRWRRFWSKLGDEFADLLEDATHGTVAVTAFVLLGVMLILYLFGAAYIVSGLVGLLEFGRKQL